MPYNQPRRILYPTPMLKVSYIVVYLQTLKKPDSVTVLACNTYTYFYFKEEKPFIIFT